MTTANETKAAATKHYAPGPWLNITTNEGVLCERIDLGKYDLENPFACAALLNDVKAAKHTASPLRPEDAYALKVRG